ncbi:HAD family hydrolase [bacterium]
MKKYELLIFDLDGTLADTRRDIADSVNYVLKKFHVEPLSVDTVTGFVGNGVHDLLYSLMPEKYHKKIKRAVKMFRKHYYKHMLDNTPLYPHVRHTLEALHNYRKIVLSNKPEKHCKKLLKGIGISRHFEQISGGDTFLKRKPETLPFMMACKNAGVDNSKALMIGDGINDIAGARASNIDSAAVTYGFTNKETIIPYKPDYMVNKFESLIDIVTVNNW